MASGNDAANAAAYTISGSPEKFSQRMNEKAKQIGMMNTNFVTPSGLDDDNHYSSAKDMALLMSYALENNDFANLTAKKSVTVEFLEPKSKKTAYAWLEKASYSIPALVIFGIWNILPFTIILLLSGLQNIDPQYYTAARVDGSKGLRIFLRITVPLLAPTIFLVCIVNTISCFKVFSELYPLFNGKPGPFNNLYTVVYYIRYAMMENRKYGIAAAAALVLFLFIFVFTMVQLLLQKKTKRR